MAEGVNEREMAEFNSALEYLNRLNTAFGLAGDSKLSLDAFTWASALSVLFMELSTKMTAQELARYREQLKEVLNLVTNNKSRGGKGNLSQDLYWKLADLELGLRMVFKESGLEMKFQESSKGILLTGGR